MASELELKAPSLPRSSQLPSNLLEFPWAVTLRFRLSIPQAKCGVVGDSEDGQARRNTRLCGGTPPGTEIKLEGFDVHQLHRRCTLSAGRACPLPTTCGAYGLASIAGSSSLVHTRCICDEDAAGSASAWAMLLLQRPASCKLQCTADAGHPAHSAWSVSEFGRPFSRPTYSPPSRSEITLQSCAFRVCRGEKKEPAKPITKAVPQCSSAADPLIGPLPVHHCVGPKWDFHRDCSISSRILAASTKLDSQSRQNDCGDGQRSRFRCVSSGFAHRNMVPREQMELVIRGSVVLRGRLLLLSLLAVPGQASPSTSCHVRRQRATRIADTSCPKEILAVSPAVVYLPPHCHCPSR
jgi:hypothetical protein